MTAAATGCTDGCGTTVNEDDFPASGVADAGEITTAGAGARAISASGVFSALICFTVKTSVPLMLSMNSAVQLIQRSVTPAYARVTERFFENG